MVMAADLAQTPVSGIQATLCGDAHLSNFGVFATPERKLVFDLNDFDEACPGPWEWDLKRLAASAVVAGRQNGFKDKDNRKLAELVARHYREAMDRFSEAPVLDVWYYHIEADQVLALFERYSRKGAKSTERMVKKARTKTREATLDKLTELVDGRRQFINDPPLLVRLSLFSTLHPGLRQHEVTSGPGTTVLYHNHRAASPSLITRLSIAAGTRPVQRTQHRRPRHDPGFFASDGYVTVGIPMRFAEVSCRFQPCLSATDNARHCPQAGVFPAA
ncbi:DUF2252 family protein [Chloroflexota bacterium]